MLSVGKFCNFKKYILVYGLPDYARKIEYYAFGCHPWNQGIMHKIMLDWTRWSIARAFPPIPSKTKSSRPWTAVTKLGRQVGWSITNLLVFISSHVTAIVTSYMMSKFGIRKKIQERSIKNLITVFCREFYDFWWKPHLNWIKWHQVTGNTEIQISLPHDHKKLYGQTSEVFKHENNESIRNGEKTNWHNIKIAVFLISHMWCYTVWRILHHKLHHYDVIMTYL